LFERAGIISLVINGDNNLILTEKSYRQPDYFGGTILLVTAYKIPFKQHKLKLDIITYTNGFFISEER
jgi:hypothetical protein